MIEEIHVEACFVKLDTVGLISERLEVSVGELKEEYIVVSMREIIEGILSLDFVVILR